MDLPKFFIADNSELDDEIFILHTEFPRFLLNVANDEVHWFEEFDSEDEKELATHTSDLIEQALEYYDQEIENFE
tara:strand:+ start:930 stop:1154 length:225 start_codon:yes stop_codon:yes gene_type:complete